MYYAVTFEIDDKILIMPLTDGGFSDWAFDVLGGAPAIPDGVFTHAVRGQADLASVGLAADRYPQFLSKGQWR